MNEHYLSGLIAAPFTPMFADGSINVSAIKAYAEYVIAQESVAGVFVCGTTGEFASLTTEERKQVVEEWVRVAKGRLKIIVHVGGTSQIQSTQLAQHAQEQGADAISSIAPYFFKPETIDDLIGFFEPVAAAASRLPFYYYNMPSMSGVSLPVHTFLSEGKKRIPNLAGVKYTHNNLMEMQQCIRQDYKAFEVLHGFDEILITGLAIGAKGAVGSTYNYIPSLYKEIMEAMEQGNLECARDLQAESVDILDIVIKHGGGVRGGKMLMRLAGIDCGPCRLPIAPFTEEEFKQIEEELRSTSFYKYAGKEVHK